MESGADAYELSESFAEPPGAYHLVLPSKWRMKWLVWKNMRAARRQPITVTVQLKRPLNEEACYPSVTKMDQQDYDRVSEYLQERFGAKSLRVSELQLKYLERVTPNDAFQEPYDLVEATFTIVEARP